MQESLFIQINKNPYKIGLKLGSELFNLHSQIIDNKDKMQNRLINFHDQCHKIIFAGQVAPRIGAVQTTYIWQFIIQYLYELENLKQPCLTLQEIDIKNDNKLNLSKTVIGDTMSNIGALLRYDLDKNDKFIAGFKETYLNLEKNWKKQAKIMDLYYWLQLIDNMDKNSGEAEKTIKDMLAEFTKLGAGNKNKFKYKMNTTALLKNRLKI